MLLGLLGLVPVGALVIKPGGKPAFTEGEAVGVMVGVVVGVVMGAVVGATVGAVVGARVGDALAVGEADMVGDAVGDVLVGELVAEVVHGESWPSMVIRASSTKTPHASSISSLDANAGAETERSVHTLSSLLPSVNFARWEGRGRPIDHLFVFMFVFVWRCGRACVSVCMREGVCVQGVQGALTQWHLHWRRQASPRQWLCL
jgi:hypothetical protein